MEENLYCLRKGTRLIGRYTVEGVLGQGGFGITYLGMDELHKKKVAKARQEEASLLFQQSLLDAGKEVNDALIQWQIAHQRILIGVEQIAALQEAVRKTELLMRHTSTNYLEVLIARQNLLEAQQIAAQDQFDKIQGVINLYHALGGGW